MSLLRPPSVWWPGAALPTISLRLFFQREKSFEFSLAHPRDLGEAKIVEWAAKQAEGNEEFLVAFKIDSQHFTIVRCVAGQQTDAKVYAAR